MITASAVLILGPIATAIWKSIKSQAVPWTVLVLITLLGVALLAVAIVKFLNLHKGEKKNNGLNAALASDIEANKQREKHRRDIFLCIVDYHKKNSYDGLKSLQVCKADELENNDELLKLCAELEKYDHPNPLAEIRGHVPQERSLDFLKEARLRGMDLADKSELTQYFIKRHPAYKQLSARNRSPAVDNTATASAKTGSSFKPLHVEALPPTPNLANKTQLGRKITGQAVVDADCILRIRNPNPIQGIDGVEFRLLSIQPELVSLRGFDPTTDDTKLRRLRFSFTDIDGKTLKGGQTGDVCVLAVTRNFAAEESLKNIIIELGGKRTNDTRNKFIPATIDHILTVEVTANGLPRTESQFHIFFSVKSDEPVFTITKLPS
jgi:hypothetical protein